MKSNMKSSLTIDIMECMHGKYKCFAKLQKIQKMWDGGSQNCCLLISIFNSLSKINLPSVYLLCNIVSIKIHAAQSCDEDFSFYSILSQTQDAVRTFSFILV